MPMAPDPMMQPSIPFSEKTYESNTETMKIHTEPVSSQNKEIRQSVIDLVECYENEKDISEQTYDEQRDQIIL